MLKRIVVCISGFGSNLQAIIDASKKKNFVGKLVLVACNKKGAYGLRRAVDAGIPTIINTDVERLFDVIRDTKPDLIALAGFMKIIPPHLVREFKNRIINIHPSLLPAYPGIHSIERALKAGEKETGVTVHYVDEGVDTGPIIEQQRIVIHKGETLESLEERVHQVEHELYPEVIRSLLL